jgi:uncharacterized protein YrzB (UPF0473 family)
LKVLKSVDEEEEDVCDKDFAVYHAIQRKNEEVQKLRITTNGDMTTNVNMTAPIKEEKKWRPSKNTKIEFLLFEVH